MEQITYTKLATNWTKVCYYYKDFYTYCKKCYGLTQKQVNELKKANKA